MNHASAISSQLVQIRQQVSCRIKCFHLWTGLENQTLTVKLPVLLLPDAYSLPSRVITNETIFSINFIVVGRWVRFTL